MKKRWIFELTAEVVKTVEVGGWSYSEAEANAKDLVFECCDGVVAISGCALQSCVSQSPAADITDKNGATA